MRRRRAPAAAEAASAFALLAISLAACGGAPAATAPAVSPTASIAPPASTGFGAVPSNGTVLLPSAVSSPVVGVVVAVDSAGLGQVSGFTLRLSGGQQVAFRVLGALDNAAAFPLGHLSEHMASAAPVRVYFRRSGDLLAVYRIEDAG